MPFVTDPKEIAKLAEMHQPAPSSELPVLGKEKFTPPTQREIDFALELHHRQYSEEFRQTTHELRDK